MIVFRVREEAERAGLKPGALIRKAGVSPSAGRKIVYNSATGRPGGPPVRTIHTPSLEAMAKVLGVDPLTLITYHED